MKRLTKFEKFGIAAALLVACSFYYMKYMYDPQAKVLSKTIKKLNKVIEQVNELKDVPSVKSIRATIGKREKKLEDLMKQLESTAVKTGKDSEITELLSRVSQRIQKNRMALDSIAPRREKITGAFFAWNAYDLALRGSFFQLISLLSDLKEMPDPVRIDEIRIEKGAAGGGRLNITMVLMI